jgi:hypothetical protein
MLIREVVDPNTQQLSALSLWLQGRMKDQAATKPLSQAAFIQMANSLGVDVTEQSLADMASREPLSNFLEPIEPGSGVIRFKGDTEAATGMSVDQAQAVVNNNAKAAMRRRQ